MVNNDAVFRISPKTLGKQIVVYHLELTVLRCSSATVVTWPVLLQKRATICFEIIFTQTTFIGFGSGSKTHMMNCFFVSGLYAQIHDSWRSYKRLFKHRHRSFPTFLYTNRYEPFSERLCGIQREEISFTARCSCNIECMLVEEVPKNGFISRNVTILSYQLTHGINVLWHNGCFWITFTDLVF